MNNSDGKAAQETSVWIGCSENLYVEVQTCKSKYKLYFGVQLYSSKCISYLYFEVQFLYFEVQYVLRSTNICLPRRLHRLSTQMVRHRFTDTARMFYLRKVHVFAKNLCLMRVFIDWFIIGDHAFKFC